VRSAGKNTQRNVLIGQNHRSGSALWMRPILVVSMQGTRRADPGRGGGRLNPLCGPVSTATPPLHAANRAG
jgi:hypothetical protein